MNSAAVHITLVMDTIVLIVIAVCVCVCARLCLFTKWHYWKVRGLPYCRPVFPVFGNMPDLLLLKPMPDIIQRIYEQTKGIPYIGLYAFHSPVLFVRDLDLAINICINDFGHFEDRGFHSNEGDPLVRNLIHQNGQEWRFFRPKVAASFNSKRVMSMLPTMKIKSEILLSVIQQLQHLEGIVDAYDICLRYTIDVLTTSALGVDANSLQNEKSSFYEMGKYLLGPKFIFHILTGSFIPSLHRMLRITASRNKVAKFFESITKQIIKYRRDNLCNRKDFVQKLLKTKKESLSSGRNSSLAGKDDTIIGQIFGIYLAGFESTGNILASALYELAKSQRIQSTLYTEIITVLNHYNGELTMGALQEMKYLHKILLETLRMYTPLPLIFRRCTKDYTIPNTSAVVEKGTMVLIPLRCILGDASFYPEPKSFHPERFSEENCRSRSAAMFMPFGIGPRICPAEMFSYTEIKTAVVYIIQHLEVCVSKETPHQYQPHPFKFLMAPKNGLKLIFKERSVI